MSYPTRHRSLCFGVIALCLWLSTSLAWSLSLIDRYQYCESSSREIQQMLESCRWQEATAGAITTKRVMDYLWVKIHLPQSSPILSLRVRTYFQAYAEGLHEPFHRFGTIEPNPIDKIGALRHHLDIPQNTSTIYLLIATSSKTIGLEREIYVGSYRPILEIFQNKDSFKLFAGLVMIFLGLATLIVYLLYPKMREHLFLAIFMLGAGVWVLSIVNFDVRGGLFLSAYEFWQTSLYWATFLGLFGLFAYLSELNELGGQRFFRIASLLYLLLFTVSLASHLVGYSSFRAFNPTFILLTGILSLPTLFLIVKSAWKGNHDSRVLLISLGIMVLFFIKDSIVYFDTKVTGVQKNTASSYVGIILVALALVYIFSHKILIAIKANRINTKELISKNQELTAMIEKVKNAERVTAIAQTTQMLAHDVRKPFSMIEAIIQLAHDTRDPDDVRAILDESLPSVSQAIASVNGMIDDIMEISSNREMKVDTIHAQKFVYEVLQSLFQFRDDVSVTFKYEIPGDLFFQVSGLKYSRVFANIIGNATEHMSLPGSIWIKVEPLKSTLARVTIGNSNSYIDEQDREHLFTPFYTKNKRKGTGLGLAIAKKIVEDHGGSIQCLSVPGRGTEFVLTLPYIQKGESSEITLPQSAKDLFRDRFQSKNAETAENSKTEELDFVTDHRLQIAIVDDEDIYKDSLYSQFSKLGTHLNIQTFTNCEILIHDIKASYKPDLIVLDVDLGESFMTGFEGCEQIRSLPYSGIICIHSNRGRLEFQSKAIASGADYFIPKPMPQSDMIEIIKACLTGMSAKVASHSFVLFEDELIFQRRWKKVAKGSLLAVAASWRDFLQENESFDWGQVSFVVVDYYLKNDETGIQVAEFIRKIRPDIKIFLCSNTESLEFSDSLIDARIDKDPNVGLDQVYKMYL